MACNARFGKEEKGSEIQLETADGLHLMKFCDKCTSVIESMRSVAISKKNEEDGEDESL